MLDFGFSVDQAKSMFFDTKAVEKAVDGAERKNLSEAGAYIMTTARGLIRSGKKAARPGQPPKSHTRRLKANIFFVWDASSRSVVVGPARFASGDGTAPSALEFGGTFRRVLRKRGKPVSAHYQPHPYMGPALAKNEDKFPSIFADSVKG
jgi:hypothetical protein